MESPRVTRRGMVKSPVTGIVTGSGKDEQDGSMCLIIEERPSEDGF